MRDEDMIDLAEKNDSIKQKTEIKYTVRSVIMFVLALGAIWFIGTILSPLFPDEIIAMLVYAVLYYLFGFDPLRFLERLFNKK